MIIQTLNNCSTVKAGFIRPKEIIKKKKCLSRVYGRKRREEIVLRLWRELIKTIMMQKM